VDVALLVQVLEYRGRAPDLVHVLHDILARGLKVGNEWNLVADALEVIEGELDASGPSRQISRRRGIM